MTSDIQAAPHGTKVLERYPRVISTILFFWRLNDPEITDGFQSGMIDAKYNESENLSF